MPSMLRQILAFLGVQWRKRHAELQLAVPGVRVRGAVLCVLQLNLGRVARQLAQGLRQKKLDALLADTGKGV